MAKPSGAALRHSRDILDVRTKPLGFRTLPAPATSPPPVERRDAASRAQLVRRIRAELDEIPGLRLTLPQAMRLFGLSENVCTRMLSELIAEGFLRRTPDGRFARDTDRVTVRGGGPAEV